MTVELQGKEEEVVGHDLVPFSRCLGLLLFCSLGFLFSSLPFGMIHIIPYIHSVELAVFYMLSPKPV